MMVQRLTQFMLLCELAIVALCAIVLPQHYPVATWLAIICGILLVLLARLLFTAYGFMSSWPYRQSNSTTLRLSLAKTAQLFFNEFATIIRVTSWDMPFGPFSKRACAHSTAAPVLLIHGYACNSGFWRGMSNFLHKEHITHHALDLAPVFGSIDSYAAQIHTAIECLVTASGHDKVIIIGHSMGGLAARAYLRDYGSFRVAKVMTLGTPHHGTTLAVQGIGRNCKEMRCTHSAHNNTIGSPWLQNLAASESKETRALFVSFYSAHDNVIFPQSSSYFPGADNVALTGIGHMSLAFDRDVRMRIISEIHAAQ